MRLRNVLLRILNRSLIKYRPAYIPASSWDKLIQHGVANGAPGGPPQPTTPDGQTSKMKDLISPFSKGSAAGSSDGATALSNAGNLYGLQVRCLFVCPVLAYKNGHSSIACISSVAAVQLALLTWQYMRLYSKQRFVTLDIAEGSSPPATLYGYISTQTRQYQSINHSFIQFIVLVT